MLTIALAIAASMCGFVVEVALAEDLNYCLGGTPVFNAIDMEESGTWYGTAANINDDSTDSYIGGEAYGEWIGGVTYEAIVTFPQTALEINKVEYINYGWRYLSGGDYHHITTSLHYGGEWHEIDTRTADMEKTLITITNGAPWYDVTKVKVEVFLADYAGVPYMWSVVSRLYELRAIGFVYTISGHVWDKNNNPVIGATITITSPALEAPINLTTDNGGYYEAINLPPNTYTITGSHPEYSFVPQEVTLDHNSDVSFYTIFGYVTRYGTGVGINGIDVIISGGDYSPGFTVTIPTTDGPTGPGYYEVTGTGNGTYTIEATNP